MLIGKLEWDTQGLRRELSDRTARKKRCLSVCDELPLNSSLQSYKSVKSSSAMLIIVSPDFSRSIVPPLTVPQTAEAKISPSRSLLPPTEHS